MASESSKAPSAVRFAPGFYRTNPRAITLREHAAWLGWWRIWKLPLRWLAAQRIKPSGGAWMPALWSDYKCDQAAFSDEFWRATRAQREAFERLGFTPCRMSRTTRQLEFNPFILDNGSINYIHPNRQHFGGIAFIKSRVPEPVNRDEVNVVFFFTAVTATGTLSCVNRALSFQHVRGQEVIRLSTESPEVLHKRFIKMVKRRAGKLLAFPDDSALRDWYDAEQTRVFEIRVERGLFVPMTDEEVKMARGKFPPPMPV